MKKLQVNLITFLFIKMILTTPVVKLLVSAPRVCSSPSRVKPDYKTGIYCFFAKHAAFRSKSKYWLTRNQVNVSDWSDMFTRGV